MATVAISGIAGFLGSHLADRLIADGHEVVGVDNLSGGDAANVPLGVRKVHWKDCCDFQGMVGLFATYKPSAVYHCAASAHEGLSVFSPARITRDTYLSTATVASAAVACGVKRFVFTSSMARYGGASRIVDSDFMPFEEWMTPRPVNPYGIAKVASEQVLSVLSQVHGIEVVIAVPHNIIAKRQRYTDPYRNVVSIMANRLLQGKPPIIYGDGEQVRCFSHVSDVVEPLVRCGFDAVLDGEIINVGPDAGAVSINEVAKMLARLCDYSGPPPIHVADRPCEVKVAWCSADKARRLLGYEARTTLEESLRDVVEWVKVQGPKEFSYHIGLEIVNDKTPRTWAERMM